MLQAANKKPRRSLPRLVFLLVVLLVVLVASLNLRNIEDWIALYHYQAPTAVAQLASQDTMTDYARKIFYVNHPAIDDKTTFNTVCPNNGGEQTIILGCYHSDQDGIFVLSVTDPQLNGVEQVTTAHEMLHAAYDRLSSKERSQVDAMLMDYYNHDLHDQRLIDTINAYKKTEPDAVVNEMHSVFGTEVASLPAPLEAYYKQYFTNRQQIAAFAAQYQSEFTSRENSVAQDDSQLSTWKTQIDSLEANLKTELNNINSGQRTLQQQRDSGDIADYNAGVPGYNSQVNQYNDQVRQLQSLITQYNQLVTARNAIALQEQQLNNELNSSATTISN